MISLKYFFEQADRRLIGKPNSRLALICGTLLAFGAATGCQNQSDTATNSGAVDQESSENGLASPELNSADRAPAPAQGERPPPSAVAEQPPPPPPASGGALGADSLMQEFQQAQMRLQEVNSKLAQIEQRANENESLQEARKEVETAAIKKIEENNPNFQDKVDALQALGQKIQDSGEVGPGAGQPSEETQNDIEEFQRQRQALTQLEREAFEDPGVQGLREDYEERLLSALKELDPDAEALIEERKELIATLQSLQQQIVQQRIQQMQGQPPGGLGAPPPPPPNPAGQPPQPVEAEGGSSDAESSTPE